MKAKVLWRAKVLSWIAWCVGIQNMVITHGTKESMASDES